MSILTVLLLAFASHWSAVAIGAGHGQPKGEIPFLYELPQGSKIRLSRDILFDPKRGWLDELYFNLEANDLSDTSCGLEAHAQNGGRFFPKGLELTISSIRHHQGPVDKGDFAHREAAVTEIAFFNTDLTLKCSNRSKHGITYRVPGIVIAHEVMGGALAFGNLFTGGAYSYPDDGERYKREMVELSKKREQYMPPEGKRYHVRLDEFFSLADGFLELTTVAPKEESARIAGHYVLKGNIFDASKTIRIKNPIPVAAYAQKILIQSGKLVDDVSDLSDEAFCHFAVADWSDQGRFHPGGPRFIPHTFPPDVIFQMRVYDRIPAIDAWIPNDRQLIGSASLFPITPGLSFKIPEVQCWGASGNAVERTPEYNDDWVNGVILKDLMVLRASKSGT